MPIPLTRSEIETFARDHLLPIRIEDLHDADDPGSHCGGAELRSSQA